MLGICGGGGYSLKAAQADKRFKAVATVSMFNSGEVRRNGFMNSQVSTIQERLKKASEARALQAAGGKVLYALPDAPPLTDEQIANLPFDLYREGTIYYGRTHKHPNSSGNYTMSSLMDLMSWDANTNTDLINQPLLMIAGSNFIFFIRLLFILISGFPRCFILSISFKHFIQYCLCIIAFFCSYSELNN